MRSASLLLVLLAAAAATAQPAAPPARLVYTTVGAGGATGPRDAPYGSGFVSVAAEHVRIRGWRTLHIGASLQGDFGRDRYSEVHIGAGATATAGPLVLTATVGPSLGSGRRGVYGPGPVWPDREPTLVRQGERARLALGLHASAQALLVVVPEVAVGLAASHDQNTLVPVSGARLVLSFGTHRQSLIRF